MDEMHELFVMISFNTRIASLKYSGKLCKDSNVDVVSALLASVEFEYTKLQGIALM